jgi:hypothetical protein
MKRESLKEFHARMRSIAGIAERPQTRRAGSWMRLNCGDRVSDIGDERHVGRLESIVQGMARITWDNGWQSHLPMEQVRRVQ